jgi:hypothetical protein
MYMIRLQKAVAYPEEIHEVYIEWSRRHAREEAQGCEMNRRFAGADMNTCQNWSDIVFEGTTISPKD